VNWIGYGLAAFLPCAVVFGFGRVLPSWARRQGRLEEPDARGTAFVVGTLLGLLVGVGIASYSDTAIARLPLLVTAVSLLMVLMLGLPSKYYLSLNATATAGLLLLVGLVPAVVKVGENASAPAAVLAGTMVLVPIGISLGAYLVNQLEGNGGVWMAAVAMATLSGVAYLEGKLPTLLILLAGLGAIVPLLAYASRWQAKVLLGDVGTFAIGALIAVAAISGGLELPAVITFVPCFLNLGLKASGRSLGQLVMRASGGSQRCSALIFIGTEVVFGLIAVLVCIWA